MPEPCPACGDRGGPGPLDPCPECNRYGPMPVPNPGSREAVAQGCLCPVLDNHHGAGIPITGDNGQPTVTFWQRGDCPLHGEGERDDA